MYADLGSLSRSAATSNTGVKGCGALRQFATHRDLRDELQDAETPARANARSPTVFVRRVPAAAGWERSTANRLPKSGWCARRPRGRISLCWVSRCQTSGVRLDRAAQARRLEK
jgi:hypothetical protein